MDHKLLKLHKNRQPMSGLTTEDFTFRMCPRSLQSLFKPFWSVNRILFFPPSIVHVFSMTWMSTPALCMQKELQLASASPWQKIIVMTRWLWILNFQSQRVIPMNFALTLYFMSSGGADFMSSRKTTGSVEACNTTNNRFRIISWWRLLPGPEVQWRPPRCLRRICKARGRKSHTHVPCHPWRSYVRLCCLSWFESCTEFCVRACVWEKVCVMASVIMSFCL